MTPNAASPRKRVLSMILKIAIPTVITVGLCFILLTGIDFNEMMDVIRRECNFWWIGLGLFLSVCAQIIRAWRWKLQLNALDIYPPLFWIVLSIFGTYAVNLVFPRLGEIWRTGYIAARQKAPFTSVFGSMVADRVADLLLVFLLTLITLAIASPAVMAFIERYPDTYRAIGNFLQSPMTWGIAVGVMAICWYIYVRYANKGFIARIRKAVIELWQGFAVVFTMPRRLLWLVLSVALWGCYFFQLYVAFFAFPFTVELIRVNGVICALVCFVLSSIAMGIPSNGGIGPWQLAVIFALTLYAPAGMSPQGAEMFRTNITAFANLVMGMETLLLIALGIFTFICIGFERRHYKKTTQQTIVPDVPSTKA